MKEGVGEMCAECDRQESQLRKFERELRDTELNVPLLRKTLEKIESLPKLSAAIKFTKDGKIGWDGEAWDQTNWAQESEVGCGTAFCFAGWALQLAGEDPFDEYPSWRARVALGIRDASAGSKLFDGSNSKTDLRRICEELAGGPL